MVKVNNLKGVSVICSKCQGSCWNPESQSETQAAVMAKYGIIANDCVNGEGNVVHCPYAKK